MNGVEILTAEEVATKYVFNWSGFWIMASACFVIAIVILLIVQFRYYLDDNGMSLSCFLACAVGILIVALFVGALFGFLNGDPVEYKTQYKVTISDEVSMNEFTEKYEIIEQDGKIYTVRERD